MIIVPAIDERNKDDFVKVLASIVEFSDKLHLDFNDGSFGNFKTVDPSEVSETILKYHDVLNFEAHLMVQNPLVYAKTLKDCGVLKMIVHYEIEDNIRDILTELNLREVKVGLAVSPETEVVDLEPFIDDIESITLMSVAPGRQGQSFISETLRKVEKLRTANFRGEIELDGGINKETMSLVSQSEVDTLVVGSYIVRADNPKENYEALVRALG